MDPATAIIASAGIGGLGNIIGGLFGQSGQTSANKANLQIARENREWQERMSNTANQRAAADLEAAGLNRILAMGKPASTPAGNIATMQNVKAPVAQATMSAANIAANTALQIAQAKNLNARTDALGGASAVGEKLGNLVDWITGKVQGTGGNTPIEPKGMLDRFVEDASQIINNISWMNGGLDGPGQKPDLSSAIAKAKTEWQAGGKAGQLWQMLIDQTKHMDLPGNMDDAQRLQWAIENIDKVDAYRKRNR